MNKRREEDRGYAMDFSASFYQPKRLRTGHLMCEEKEDQSALKPTEEFNELDSFMQMRTTTPASSPWRLPSSHTLTQIQTYLNEQLKHVVALSSTLVHRDTGPKYGTRMFLTNEKEAEDDIDRVCTLDLARIWKFLAVETSMQADDQKSAECALREVMDLLSFLLFVRNRELDNQNRLNENLSHVEKQLERKIHSIKMLTADQETLKQNIAYKENLFKAKEKNLLTERKTLQSEKKTLEINCARLQGLETAYKAQLRRKDVEYARLKKNLQDAVARASKENRGLTMSKILNGVSQLKQASIRSQSKESKLTKQIMDSLERKKAELLYDNEALSKRYDTLQHRLESLTSQYKKAVQLFLAQKNLMGDNEALEKLASAPIDDFYPTPFNMATKKNITQHIAASMEALDNKLKQLKHVICNELPSAEARSDKEVINRLHQKLVNAHAIIKEQDQLIQASLSTPALTSHIDIENSHWRTETNWKGLKKISAVDAITSRSSLDAAADEDIEQQKTELALSRHNLEKERKLLQEQAFKLDKDRLDFEIAKRDDLYGVERKGVNMPSFREPISLSSSESADFLTPKRQRRKKRLDSDVGNSPFDLPISATPVTAALLKKIGINVPTKP